MSKPKVTVVGAGNVGATTAQRIVEKEIADVVLVDIVEGLAKGKALDMMQSASVEGFTTKIQGAESYEATQDSDIVVITAGLARKPGMSRDDLLQKNAEIVSGIATQCLKYSPNAIFIIVTNPLDVMTYLAWKITGLKTERVFGMAGELDSSRYACFIAEELSVAAKDVKPVVLGGHGDQMVPVPEQTMVKGKSVSGLIEPKRMEEINQRTRDGGAEIVKYLKTGSAYYAPSSSTVRMVRSVLEDRKEVIPSCVYLNGQYGLKDVYCGVPVKLGKKGVEEIVEMPLSSEQQEALKVSAEHVRENCKKLNVSV